MLPYEWEAVWQGLCKKWSNQTSPSLLGAFDWLLCATCNSQLKCRDSVLSRLYAGAKMICRADHQLGIRLWPVTATAVPCDPKEAIVLFWIVVALFVKCWMRLWYSPPHKRGCERERHTIVKQTNVCNIQVSGWGVVIFAVSFNAVLAKNCLVQRSFCPGAIRGWAAAGHGSENPALAPNSSCPWSQAIAALTCSQCSKLCCNWNCLLLSL